MKVTELKNDPTIIDWLLTINAKSNTEKAYLQGMQDFTEYTGKDPETLLKEAEEDIRAGKLMRQRRIKRDLIGFRKHLQDLGKAPLTVKGRIVGVKSFYETFDIEIPKLPRTGKAKPLEKNKEIPDKSDLQEVLKVCDPLEKAILLTGASSGLGANELCNLKVGEFRKGFDPDSGITTLKLRREKVEFDFITFLSSESSQAVWDYLDYRSRTVDTNQTRKKSRLEKQKVYTDNDYLFICRQIPTEFLDTKDDNLRKLDTRALTKVYRRLAEKARKSTPLGDWGFIRSHNIRKYFNSALLNAGADSFTVNFLMGHTLDDTQGAYFRASPEKLREIYQNFIPYLTISKEADVSESPEFQKMKRENKALQAELVTKAVDRAELSELKKELERIDKAKKDEDELRAAAISLLQEQPAFLEKMMEKMLEKKLSEMERL
jgi:site-specific recombinase XerD